MLYGIAPAFRRFAVLGDLRSKFIETRSFLLAPCGHPDRFSCSFLRLRRAKELQPFHKHLHIYPVKCHDQQANKFHNYFSAIIRSQKADSRPNQAHRQITAEVQIVAKSVYSRVNPQAIAHVLVRHRTRSWPTALRDITWIALNTALIPFRCSRMS